jgi:hypothetical protein
LSTIAVSGTEREQQQHDANPSTNANTSGARRFTVSFQSYVPAVCPVTATSVPGSLVATGATRPRAQRFEGGRIVAAARDRELDAPPCDPG